MAFRLSDRPHLRELPLFGSACIGVLEADLTRLAGVNPALSLPNSRPARANNRRRQMSEACDGQ